MLFRQIQAKRAKARLIARILAKVGNVLPKNEILRIVNASWPDSYLKELGQTWLAYVNPKIELWQDRQDFSDRVTLYRKGTVNKGDDELSEYLYEIGHHIYGNPVSFGMDVDLDVIDWTAEKESQTKMFHTPSMSPIWDRSAVAIESRRANDSNIFSPKEEATLILHVPQGKEYTCPSAQKILDRFVWDNDFSEVAPYPPLWEYTNDNKKPLADFIREKVSLSDEEIEAILNCSWYIDGGLPSEDFAIALNDRDLDVTLYVAQHPLPYRDVLKLPLHDDELPLVEMAKTISGKITFGRSCEDLEEEYDIDSSLFVSCDPDMCNPEYREALREPDFPTDKRSICAILKLEYDEDEATIEQVWVDLFVYTPTVPYKLSPLLEAIAEAYKL